MSGVGMYEPRPVLLQRRNAPDALPGGGVMSPLPPGRMARIGRSGARPLDTMISPSEKMGVGAVIFELRASRQRSAPVSGSYPRTKFGEFVPSSGRPPLAGT